MAARRPPLLSHPAARRALGCLLAGLVALALLGATVPAKRTPAAGARPPRRGATAPGRRAATAAPRLSAKQQAADALALEQLGAYVEAARRLRALRASIGPDADLELALALDDARSGALDSAAARLRGPILTRALADSMPYIRRHRYVWQRDALWINGTYDGWPWYIARARAEVAAEQGRWAEALEAAKLAVSAYPLSGHDWLILAVCAGRAGDLAQAESAARFAAYVDPSQPEAHYLSGLFEWRAGRRLDAQASFRAAVALDSSWEAPALALVRSRLPGATPDTLPTALLTGPRRVELLTSPARPKPEEFVQMDLGSSVLEQRLIPFPDSLKPLMKPIKLFLNVLVDDAGRPVLTDLPWFPADQIPVDALHLTLASVPGWKFRPGIRLGRPYPMWTPLQVTYDPQGPSQPTH